MTEDIRIELKNTIDTLVSLKVESDGLYQGRVEDTSAKPLYIDIAHAMARTMRVNIAGMDESRKLNCVTDLYKAVGKELEKREIRFFKRGLLSRDGDEPKVVLIGNFEKREILEAIEADLRSSLCVETTILPSEPDIVKFVNDIRCFANLAQNPVTFVNEAMRFISNIHATCGDKRATYHEMAIYLVSKAQGGSGKSEFVNCIREALERYDNKTSTTKFSQYFEGNPLRYPLCIAEDVMPKIFENEDLINQIIDHFSLTDNPKCKQGAAFTPKAALAFTSNYYPRQNTRRYGVVEFLPMDIGKRPSEIKKKYYSLSREELVQHAMDAIRHCPLISASRAMWCPPVLDEDAMERDTLLDQNKDPLAKMRNALQTVASSVDMVRSLLEKTFATDIRMEDEKTTNTMRAKKRYTISGLLTGVCGFMCGKPEYKAYKDAMYLIANRLVNDSCHEAYMTFQGTFKPNTKVDWWQIVEDFGDSAAEGSDEDAKALNPEEVNERAFDNIIRNLRSRYATDLPEAERDAMVEKAIQPRENAPAESPANDDVDNMIKVIEAAENGSDASAEAHAGSPETASADSSKDADERLACLRETATTFGDEIAETALAVIEGRPYDKTKVGKAQAYLRLNCPELVPLFVKGRMTSLAKPTETNDRKAAFA